MVERWAVGQREYRPYDELRSISYYAIKRAESEIEGSFYEYIVSIVFDAFCIESYLNHLGVKKLLVHNFIDFEQKSPNEKLMEISRELNILIDKRTLPFCHFDTIFDFRDSIVHAKTDTINTFKVKIDDKTGLPRFPKSKIEVMATLKNAKKFFESTTNMVVFLNEEAGMESIAFGCPYDALWSSAP